MPPAVLFGQNDERLTVSNPHQPVIGTLARDDPSRIRFVEDTPDGTGGDVRQEKLAFVPKSAQLFDQQFLRVARPFDLPEVVAFGGDRHGEPASLLSLSVDHANAQCRDGLPHPGKSDFLDFRIRRVARNEDRPESHVGLVRLHKDDPLPIRAPGCPIVRHRAVGGTVSEANLPVTAQITHK